MVFRVVQRPAQGRTSRRGNLLLPRRGEDRHRELVAPLQHRAAAWIAGLQAAGVRSLRTSHGRAAGCATPSSFATRYGFKAINALTVQPDHSVGAGHHGSENRSLPNPHQSAYPSLCRPLHLVAASSTMLAHPNAVLGARQPSHLIKRPIRFSSSSRLTSLKQVIDYKCLNNSLSIELDSFLFPI
jgi:hypothetical protein